MIKVTVLSHKPLFIFASVFADKGAIKIISDHYYKYICNTRSPFFCQFHSSSSKKYSIYLSFYFKYYEKC